jgi:FKBP-type peptidyl-prolyl cis-trans isomerase FkpA
MKYFWLLAATLILFAGCKKDDEVDQTAVDKAIITQYLADHNITAQYDSISGIYYVIERPGYSGHPDYNSKVEVSYKGYLTNGTVFDKTQPGLTASLYLSSVITGWAYAIPLLQRGGSGTFFIPSKLAYGTSEIKDSDDTDNDNDVTEVLVPANSVLIFEVNLINFQ